MSAYGPEARFFFGGPLEYVDTGTARLGYRRWGAGEPVLFVHGWPFASFIFRKVLARLAPRYACWAVDLPGAGASVARAGNDFSLRGNAEHLRRFARAVGLDGYRVVAHDTGGSVARRLAALEGARVRQLVLIDTELPGHRIPFVEAAQRLAGLPGARALFQRLLRSERFVRSPLGYGLCVAEPSLLWGELYDELIAPAAWSPARAEALLRAARGLDFTQVDALAEDHGRIEAEVLLVWGERDPYFPIARARAMAAEFRRSAGLVEIAGARLLPHEERPGEVAAALEVFFASASAPAPA